ncbi:MAG: efflux RND transporter periplasmic adaptor subunit [Chitinophagales bacterium]|nr:efflux RND transporter periplasmic adaptor subunit [Chitinophagales bacterium]MCB0513174.1 efflux RND transporter periplasmic adaptor subunit [Bacteroidota bacterium]MCB9074144.1 efflux RND transporter periplasmic adaptor subunit [Chitinophagales bacterium]HMU98653.1 efflux RND transporter periplasmic adaptor subunit [Chitinophagales bacterium]HMW95095.1 efflux RND transporter periplasmic adaptor subunit [Chitinophagales bacterium]
MRKNRIIQGVALILSMLMFTYCSNSETSKNIEANGETVKVTLSQTEENTSGSNATASGRLVSKNSVNVSTRMMGYITSMSVKVGQSVKAGQLLVTINNADIQAKGGQVDAQIMQAQANYDIAKKDFERFQNLYNNQSASQKELDDMKARFEISKAGLEASKQMKNEVNAQYRYTNLTAPISGVVTMKFAEQGDLANPGMPLLTIESPSILQAQVMVSEQNIIQVKQGMQVKVVIKSTGKEITGTVAEINQSAEYTGGQYIVKINMPTSSELLPGMYVNARFPFESKSVQLAENSSSVVIPKSALIRNGQMTGVYTVSSQNTAILRWLKLGKDLGNDIEVLSGLNANEAYILSADGKLYNGVKVSTK